MKILQVNWGANGREDRKPGSDDPRGKLSRVLLLAALLLPSLALSPMSASPKAVAKAQPILMEMAARGPEASVAVIVQRAAKDNSAEQAVARLGGKVTKDLHIINAFAAEIAAKAIPQLAKETSVRWISYDAPMVKADCNLPCIETSRLQSAYVQTVGANRLWNEQTTNNQYNQGQGIGVAVVDSGLNANHPDLKMGSTSASRVVAQTAITTTSTMDNYGHGSHVAGIIGGNGRARNSAYVGMAPSTNVINVKVGNNQGAVNGSDVVEGLQYVLDNKSTYNIRVVNLSLTSSVQESYNTSPLDAALEILWFDGIVVVVAGGNNQQTAPNVVYPPANDPFVITVGATSDQGTAGISDDTLAPYSAYGTTEAGVSKPDMVAPGTNIISLLASSNSVLATQYPDHIVNNYYFRLSGTSMAAPVVAGAVALLLQDEPTLTPDNVKYRLKATARGFNRPGAGAGYLDAYAAVHSTVMGSSNTGTAASQMLWTGNTPVTWDSVNWGSVNWGSVNWGSVNWGTVNWGTVNWGAWMGDQPFPGQARQNDQGQNGNGQGQNQP